MAKHPLLSVVNAKTYFDLSTRITETKKTATTMSMKLPRKKKLCTDFLRHRTHAKYVYRTSWDRNGLSGAGYADS